MARKKLLIAVFFSFIDEYHKVLEIPVEFRGAVNLLSVLTEEVSLAFWLRDVQLNQSRVL